MKRLIILPALLLTMLSAAAQNKDSESAPRMLTLEECRGLAVKNNAKLSIANGNVEAAEELRKEAFTKYFPSVQAGGMAFASNKPVIDLDMFNIVTLQMIKRGVSANVTAIQPVFAGGRIVNSNKLAEVGVEASGLERENAIDDVNLTTEKYYWQLVTLKSKKKTLEKVITLVDTLQYQVDVALKAGVTTRNELLKVQLRRNDLKSMMVDLDNGISLSKMLLAQYIGLDGEEIDIADEIVPEDMPPYPDDLYIEPSVALNSTVDYRLLGKKVKAAELQEKLALGDNLPTVGVGAGYFYDDVINEKHGFGAVFVSVSVPITSWWGGSHAIKRRKIETANARRDMDNLSQMLCINMVNTWDDLTSSYRKMQIAKESIAQSAENLRMNQNFFLAGVSNVTDLLDAQTLYRQSLDQFTEAYGEYCVARATYLDATGQDF